MNFNKNRQKQNNKYLQNRSKILTERNNNNETDNCNQD